jgi:salicylate hydroxylase
MEINIVGSGSCGLTAAIGLRRAGHKVKVFERASTATAFGAGVVLGQNASLVLTEYGLDWTAAKCNQADGIHLHHGTTMQRLSTTHTDKAEYAPRPGITQYLAHRVDLTQALVDLATSADESSTPVEIVYNAHVTAYDALQGSLTLANGEVHKADLVVAADGVHSCAPAHLLGHESVRHTGTSVVRWMLSTESLESDPETRSLLQDPKYATFWISADRQKYLIQYPLRLGTLQNFALYIVHKETHELNDQTMRSTCDRERVHKELDGFSPAIHAMVEKAPNDIPVWKLGERDPMPAWHKSKLVILGDAAHPMLPNQGQGLGMVVEDAAALAVVLRDMPPGPSAEQLEERLSIFEKIRKPRASVAQLLSSVPYYEDPLKTLLPQLLEHLTLARLPASGAPNDVRPWFYKYDVFKEAEKALAAQQI